MKEKTFTDGIKLFSLEQLTVFVLSGWRIVFIILFKQDIGGIV